MRMQGTDCRGRWLVWLLVLIVALSQIGPVAAQDGDSSPTPREMPASAPMSTPTLPPPPTETVAPTDVPAESTAPPLTEFPT